MDELRQELIRGGCAERNPRGRIRCAALRIRPARLGAAAGAVMLVIGGCGAPAPNPPRNPANQAPAAAGAVDSILPPAEAFARFTRGLPEIDTLSGGYLSRQMLITAFTGALVRRDTAALAAMAVDRAEYAFLYFPTSVYSQPAYRLPPEIAWMLHAANSGKGLARLLDRVGGRNVDPQRHACTADGHQGDNTFWRDCTFEYSDPGHGTVRRRLLGAIMERNGRFKILSFANEF